MLQALKKDNKLIIMAKIINSKICIKRFFLTEWFKIEDFDQVQRDVFDAVNQHFFICKVAIGTIVLFC